MWMLRETKHKEFIVWEKIIKGSKKESLIRIRKKESCVWTLCYNSMVRFRFAMISFNLTFYNRNVSSIININQQNFKPGNYMA